MARTIASIKNEMTTTFLANTTLQEMYDFNPSLPFEDQFSKLSIESILFDVVAFAIWSLENILEIAIGKQNQAIKAQKIHSRSWYAMMAKRFQYGYSLDAGEIDYDNAGIDEASILSAQKVKFASVTNVLGGLKMKIAGLDGSGLLAPISSPEFNSFQEYMSRVKAAGDNISFVNEVADSLKLELKIYRNPLILDADGKRTDGTDDTPIANAIDNYIKSMDFGRRFVPAFLIDELQKVEGVEVPELILAQSKFALFPWADIPAEGVEPNSGYVRIYNPVTDLIITYEIWHP